MKIILIQFTGRGGMQLYVSQLANALSKNNNVSVVLARRLYNKKYYSDKPKILLIPSPLSYIRMLILSSNPWTYYKIVKLIKKENPDVIHAPSEFLWLSLILPFLTKYPFVITEHDPSLHEGTALNEKLMFIFGRLYTRKRADAIIVHGENLKNYLVNKGVSINKIHVIPHGEFSFYTKWAHIGVKETKSILYFGSIRDYKGIQYLIEAGQKIISEIPSARITIAGEGDFSKYAALIASKENISAYEIDNRFIPDEEVAALFQKAAVVVLPYIDGSQTGVVPIAYSFGKPVVVTNVGSIAEVVDEGKTGFVVPPRDSKALAQALIKLLSNDELRKKMGENAQSKINGDLSWDLVAQNTLEVYKGVICKKRN